MTEAEDDLIVSCALHLDKPNPGKGPVDPRNLTAADRKCAFSATGFAGPEDECHLTREADSPDQIMDFRASARVSTASGVVAQEHMNRTEPSRNR